MKCRLVGVALAVAGLAAANLAVMIFVLAAAAQAAEVPADPLDSPVWKELAAKFFASSPVVFDERVRIITPSITENQAQVPVTADARGLGGVTKMIVFADLNPIQHVLTLMPAKAAPFISFRMKIEQATPIRAAALTEDGTWHVGGLYLDAAGGGCSAPAQARNDQDWSDTVGQAQGKLWRELDGMTRARFRVRHPMDTGLAKDNTPAYFIERVDLKSSAGESLATVQMFEPVSEDPTLTLIVRLPSADPALDIEGRDNNGGVYHSTLAAPSKQSALQEPGRQ